ncbi:PQQ-binding-like beta-propeller repeat protein, partial [bacterium]|nr:PQQ-binding-like beta-propeller repeat protein [bacterium]
DERLGSAVEPIVADGLVFAGTHSGNLYALDAQNGMPVWRVQANAPFLHAPATADGIVVAGTTDGPLYGLEARTGKLLWSLVHGHGGFTASPLIDQGTVYACMRSGTVFAADLKTGATEWVRTLDAPIRQTPAFADGRLYVTGEDLRLRCFDARTSRVLWTSEPAIGQTARDYYPVIARGAVIVRTNPTLPMPDLIAQDRSALCRAAGVDGSRWEDVDAWVKSARSNGSPELWAKEQAAILAHLEAHPESRTFFAFDPDTGKPLPPAPVLWVAGCQGVGTPPNVLPDGRLFVHYRTAYGKWSRGVAPLVGLGLYDLKSKRIELLHHDGVKHARKMPWNTFWGTADESQNFVVAGRTVLITHQGTLAGFDLDTGALFTIAGKRDTWGGYPNVPCARNEWHGPARSGVAVAGNRLYWQTGSRILCIAMGQRGESARPSGFHGSSAPTQHTHKTLPPRRDALEARCRQIVEQLLDRRWAPYPIALGLAGREFHFDDSAELFEALIGALPLLDLELRAKVKARLAEEWTQYPPFTDQAWYPLDKGQRREWAPPPTAMLRRTRKDGRRPFCNVHVAWLYAERCEAWPIVLRSWLPMRGVFRDFVKTGWGIDGGAGDVHANRTLASLLAFAHIAERAGDGRAMREARAMADSLTTALVAWWERSAKAADLPVFTSVKAWDSMLRKGGPLFHRVGAHKAKLALMTGLTPEVAAIVLARTPKSVERLWGIFELLCPTWYLAGEERQVHFGENYMDGPDLGLAAFQALAWLRKAPPEALMKRLDMPFCRADLAHLSRLTIALTQPPQ